MKKLLSVLLTISLLLTSTVLFTTNVSAIEPKIWDGSVAASFASGTGLESDPFIIETAEQLAYLVSVGASGKYIKLANDIYLNDTSNCSEWETNPPQNAWVSTKDCGYFDGDNHTIYGLYCHAEKAALFYSCTTVRNLTIKDSYVYGTAIASGIVNTADEVTSCYNYALVKSDDDANGIVFSAKKIANCHNFGIVVAKDSASGIGRADTITHSSNHGDVIGNVSGGIVANVSFQNKDNYCSDLDYCYNVGTITAEKYAGGIVGVAYSPYSYRENQDDYYSYLYNYDYYLVSIISNSYNSGTINGSCAGGIVGKIGVNILSGSNRDEDCFITSSACVYRCYNVGVINGSEYKGQLSGYTSDFTINGITRYTTGLADTYYFNPEANVQYGVGNWSYDSIRDCQSLSGSEAVLQESYERFDFADVWVMSGNPDYPYPELKDNLQPHDHTYSETVNSEASCTQDGSKTLTCWCGDTYDEVILAQGHKYEETIVEEATCTEDGLKTLLCFCGDTYDEVIPATGHDYDETVVEATCAQAGSKTYLCHCGETYIETIPALGHNIVTITVEPTCTQNGETYSQCSVCKTIFGEKETLEATGHTYKENIDKNATCTESGIKVYTCPCGDEYTEIISATGHKLKLYSQPSTCTDAGFEYYICENCGNMIGDTEYLPKLGHSYKASVIAEADCTSDGEILYTCEKCKDSYTQKTLATGHSFSEWTVEVEPTCTESGVKRRVCADCSEIDELELPMVEHSWEAEFTIDKHANCTENGSKSIHCSDCQATKDTTEVSATGHNESDWIVTIAPTKKTDGKQIKKCTSCGFVLAEEFLPKTLGPNDKVHSVTIDNISVNYKDSASLNTRINVADEVNYSVKYTSSDCSVATVDENGNIYGAGKGNTTITCTVTDEFGNVVSDTCDVEVNYTFGQWLIVILLFGWIWY